MVRFIEGTELIIEGQLYPTSGNIRTCITITELPTCVSSSTAKVACRVYKHIISITENNNGSFIVNTKDGSSIPVSVVQPEGCRVSVC